MANRRGSGKGGRKPLPTSIKLASGIRAARIPTGEPNSPQGQPEAPAHFDDYEREGWITFVRDVDKLGLLSTVDGHAAGIYAMAYGGARHDRDDIKANGRYITGAHGGKVLNPAVTSLNQNIRSMLSVLSSYGLTPSDRSRLRATDRGEVDPLDEFLRQTV
jgi:P27 family predicted phage terminase small subunit